MIDKAWKLIESKAHWCKGASAVNIDGGACSPVAAEAQQWCVLGALARIYPDREDRIQIEQRIRFDLLAARGPSILTELAPDICTWNDDPWTKHADVVSLLARLDV